MKTLNCCLSAAAAGAALALGVCAEAGETLKVPDGFLVEQIAGPPLVERPMLVSFDDRGRLFVADSAGVNLRGAELSKNPPHSIRMLEDTNGDGIFDRSTLFADKMVFPQGIVWHEGAVYVSSPPSLWKLTDTDGDGVADQREELVTGFANTGVADDMHGGSLGPDGRIYWCAGRFPHEIRRPGGPLIHKGTAPLILRCRTDGSEVEVVCGSQGNAVGVAFTPEGDFFACGTFLAPNSMGAGLRDAIIHCVDGAEYPVRDRVLNEHKRTGDLLPPLTHLGVAAASDLMIYQDDALGSEYRGNLFSALFNMHKIVRHVLERNGATFTCRNEDFLVSSDPDFHPTDVLEDADGSLLVVDTGGWFRIGCPTSQIAKPEVKGAIYRIRRPSAPRANDPRGLALKWESLTARKLADVGSAVLSRSDADVGSAVLSRTGVTHGQSLTARELAGLLDDRRFAVRDRAVQQLAKIGEAALPDLKEVLRARSSVLARINAVWAATRMDGKPARAVVRLALSDAEAGVRQAAARSAGLFRDAESLPRLMELVRTDTPPIRREAATALGRIRQRSAVPALLDGLRFGGDRFLEHALIFALIEIGDRDATVPGLRDGDSFVHRGVLIALDQMEAGRLTPEMVTPFLNPADPLLQETALWVIAHHSDWGGAMAGFFRDWLRQERWDENRREELKRQLIAFSIDAAIQDLMAETLRDGKTPASARLLLLEAMAQAPLSKLPVEWRAELRRSLNDSNEQIVRQAVATVRAVPPDKQPVLGRVDAQINFENSEGPFAGTRLTEHFYVQWSGLLRVPKDGVCTFCTESDDGSRLFIDGKLVVDNGGFHAMKEKTGALELRAGDHEIRVDYFQGGGASGCKVSWACDGRKEIIPETALFHHKGGGRNRAAGALAPGLNGDYFAIGEGFEDFPDLSAVDFGGPLLRVALDQAKPEDVRVAALAAAAPRLDKLDGAACQFLLAALDKEKPPLVRIAAADALGHAKLNASQLQALTRAIAAAGPLELPKLLAAFEQSASSEIGKQLVAALELSPGLPSLPADAVARALKNYSSEVQHAAEPLLKRLAVDKDKQMARLAALEPVLTGGDIQRGRELFFGKKAACSTCHNVQGQGGLAGPNLTKIAAIRTGRDFLEAIAFPSASFARGYEPYLATTIDGELQTGVITRETADAIYLASGANSETRLLRSAIKGIQEGTVSIMPEGLDAQLSRQELGDLIAFLQSLR